MNGPVKNHQTIENPMQALGLALRGGPAGRPWRFFSMPAHGTGPLGRSGLGGGVGNHCTACFPVFCPQDRFAAERPEAGGGKRDDGGGLQKTFRAAPNDDVNRLAGSIETIAAHQRMLVEKIKQAPSTYRRRKKSS